MKDKYWFIITSIIIIIALLLINIHDPIRISAKPLDTRSIFVIGFWIFIIFAWYIRNYYLEKAKAFWWLKMIIFIQKLIIVIGIIIIITFLIMIFTK